MKGNYRKPGNKELSELKEKLDNTINKLSEMAILETKVTELEKRIDKTEIGIERLEP